MEEDNSSKTPVTILTGFLGSGKTTLLNRILKEKHGKKIAVIENEFGEVGVDQDLVIHEDEEVVEMNKGCICCTVRGDLIRILEKFTKQNHQFDHLIIETTGLANPAPVAQTFLTQEKVAEHYTLDAIVTLVDAKHIEHHLGKDDEAKEQIAFADVIVINKTDLISDTDLETLKAKIKSINAVAEINTSINADISISKILDIRSFDLKQKLEVDESFLEIEYPFEFMGTYDFNEEEYTLVFDEGPDPSMKILFFEIGSETIDSEAINEVAFLYSEEAIELSSQSNTITSGKLYELNMSEKKCSINVTSGRYLVATEHHPSEFNLKIVDSKDTELTSQNNREFKPSHEHDDEVSSVGITIDGDLNIDKLNEFFNYVINEFGTDIYRMKGIISVENEPQKVVFQGVHMLLSSALDKKWAENEKRMSTFVFIGKNLDRNLLTQGFLKCRSQSENPSEVK